MTTPTVETATPAMLGDRWLDITDPDVYRAGVPHGTFERLRREDPVSWWEERDGGRGYWAITRYRDIVDLNRDFKTFTSRQGIRLEEMDEEQLAARKTMMEMDPPEHTRLRRLVQGGFTRRMVASYEAAIRDLATELLDDVLPRGRFDFTVDVARQLPLRMLGRLLGAPQEDYDWLVAHGDAMIGNSDPEFTEHVVDQSDTEKFRLMPFRSPSGIELFEYAQRLADARRAGPTGDVVSQMLAPTMDGEPLTDLEFNNFFTLMVAAGNDTTRYSMAAGLLALLDHPDQLQLLQERPELMPSAVEEMLRWSSVTMHFRRTATRDVEVHGRTIRAGDKIVLWWISGDFDDAQFPDPFRFDITREPNEHLAFGRGGPHRCIGEWLARLEIRVTMEQLLPRLGTVRVAGPVERLRSNFISGIKHLPVEVTLR
ncbi:cytochrome P450 [Egicoccus sp. AB-alg6-2]|uniref:cytochrome P450 n=1 Tax=Egicoccus sp. AB-alg6-2 TaxID=3242692 RepID=UPI00359E6BCF